MKDMKGNIWRKRNECSRGKVNHVSKKVEKVKKCDRMKNVHSARCVQRAKTYHRPVAPSANDGIFHGKTSLVAKRLICPPRWHSPFVVGRLASLWSQTVRNKNPVNSPGTDNNHNPLRHPGLHHPSSPPLHHPSLTHLLLTPFHIPIK